MKKVIYIIILQFLIFVNPFFSNKISEYCKLTYNNLLYNFYNLLFPIIFGIIVMLLILNIFTHFNRIKLTLFLLFIINITSIIYYLLVWGVVLQYSWIIIGILLTLLLYKCLYK